MKARHKGREIALQALYAEESGGSLRETMKQLGSDATVLKESIDFAGELIKHVESQKKELDALIAGQARNWKLERVALVDRTILRIAIAEMMGMDDIPVKVSIDEAIELAKKFSTEKSGKFVNGILDPIAKQRVRKS